MNHVATRLTYPQAIAPLQELAVQIKELEGHISVQADDFSPDFLASGLCYQVTTIMARDWVLCFRLYQHETLTWIIRLLNRCERCGSGTHIVDGPQTCPVDLPVTPVLPERAAEVLLRKYIETLAGLDT
jgi:hypothetical protein